MAEPAEFDIAAAHKYFAAYCFNSAWDLIDKSARTPDEELLMVALNQASIFHWLNRADCDSRRLSIGYWQASRIHALLGNAAEALRYATICLSYSDTLEPFYIGYAHEALARAAKMSGDHSLAQEHLARAHEQVALVTSEDDRKQLLKDLAELG